MYQVHSIEPVHAQWTVKEFTYAYLRVLRAASEKQFLIAHVLQNQFSIYLPPENIRLPLEAKPEPIRIHVAHPFDMAPGEMSRDFLLQISEMVFQGAYEELAKQCPKTRQACFCEVVRGQHACGTTLGRRTNTEFTIDGTLTT